MAYICTKNIKCADCEHFRFDEDEERMACFAAFDIATNVDNEIKKGRKTENNVNRGT